MTGDARAPITLALIRRRYSPFGGAERFIERSLQGLAGTGVLPTLVCADWDRADGVAPDWEVVRLGPPRGLGRAQRELAFERDVHGFLARRRFDVVQSHERIAGLPVFRAGDGLHCEWLRQRRGVQSVMAQWLTRISPYHRFCLDRERLLFAHPGLRIVICNSEMVRSEIAEHFPGALHKVRVVRNGIDTRLFTPATDPQRQKARIRLGLGTALPVILYVGSGFERKGVGTVLRVAALVPKAQFLLVGQDKHMLRYQRQAAELALADRVRFLGATDDVPTCLDAADAFIFPTLYDPGPNAVLEALSKGLPVLTSHKCGLAELIAPARAGFVHDALDVESFARSLNKLLDQAQRRSMGTAAREVALGLSLDALTVNLRKLYQELLP
jgi:UDP-glucose:(heptosyl)LPS alpha-1,3-glucosyltransferase